MGAKYWPVLGAAYCLVAVKRVQGMRMIRPAWRKNPKLAASPVSALPRAASPHTQHTQAEKD
jgi:hypothetical protein